MTIELTTAQRHALEKGDVVQLSDPETNTDYIVLSADAYRQMRRLLDEVEDNATQKAFLDASHRSALQWMRDNPY